MRIKNNALVEMVPIVTFIPPSNYVKSLSERQRVTVGDRETDKLIYDLTTALIATVHTTATANTFSAAVHQASN